MLTAYNVRIAKDQLDAELAARYERINQAWKAARMPTLVTETPNFRAGWRVMWDWIYRRYMVPNDLPQWWRGSSEPEPHSGAAWENEVHIWSHTMSPVRFHSLEHVAIEEEGTRLVLGWWLGRQ